MPYATPFKAWACRAGNDHKPFIIANYYFTIAGNVYTVISNSYSTGNVTGNSDIGGLVGWNRQGTITNSYWDIGTSGQSTSTGGTGRTTTEMMQFATFAGWSIANTGGSSSIWRIYEGHTYHLLRSFLTPLTLTANNDTKTYDGLAYSSGNGVSYPITTDKNRVFGTLTFSGTSQGARNAGAGLFTSEAVNYEISPTVFGYQPQEGEARDEEEN